MILNYAKNFIKEYDIKSIDTNSLEKVISKLGYDFVVYNPLFDYDDNIAAIIEGFNIANELKNTCCFTCKSELANCIFVRYGIEEKELVHLLLHEICHIYMHHIHNNPTEKSAYYEYEANKFADEIKYYVNLNIVKNNIKQKILYTVPAFIALSLIIAFVLNLKNNNNNEFNFPMQETSAVITDKAAQSPAEAITEVITTESIQTITETSTEEFTELEENEKLYYVSSSGTKYHTKDCYHINPDNCTALTLEQVEEMGYTPCKTCRPDKQN